MTPIKAMIVEDEPLARTRLRHLLDAHTDVRIVAECGSARAAAAAFDPGVDVLFLDIRLGDGNGLELLREARSEGRPVVIFTSAHSEYAPAAFDLDAADYLVKPFDAERLSRALDRARRTLGGGRPAASAERRGERRERFAVRSRGEIVFVKTADVDWISAEGNYARLHAGPQSYLLRESMQSLDETLDSDTFIRVHRSAIVNLERVQKLVSGPEGAFVAIVLSTGAAVPLGPSYRARLEQVLGHKF